MLAGLSKLKEIHSQYKDVSIDEEATFENPTDNQVIETEHCTPDADIQGAQPRNSEHQIVPERRTTEDTAAELLEPSNNVNEQIELEQSNSNEEPLKDMEKEKEELRPGLALDTCMQPPYIANIYDNIYMLSYGKNSFAI